MKKPEITKGNWEWVENESQWGGTWLFSGNKAVIDYAGCGSHDSKVSKANAKAIAATPDLIEALLEIVNAADGEGWSELDAGFTKARAALIKAGCKE